MLDGKPLPQPCLSIDWLTLEQAFCRQPQLLWLMTTKTLAHQKALFLANSLDPLALKFFCSVLYDIPLTFGRRCNIEFPVRPGHRQFWWNYGETVCPSPRPDPYSFHYMLSITFLLINVWVLFVLLLFFVYSLLCFEVLKMPWDFTNAREMLHCLVTVPTHCLEFYAHYRRPLWWEVVLDASLTMTFKKVSTWPGK